MNDTRSLRSVSKLNSRKQYDVFDEHIILEASKALQHELYLLHKQPPNASNRKAFVQMLKQMVETAYPHLSHQKHALCMLDPSTCDENLSIHKMYVRVYNNRENTEKLFGKSTETESRFDVYGYVVE